MIATGTGQVVREGRDLTVEICADNRMIVNVRGAVDAATAPLLRVVLDTVVARRPDQVLVDLSETVSIDSQGLLTLVAARRRLAARHCDLVLCGPVGEVRQMFDRAGLGRAFTVVPSTAEARCAPALRV